MQHNPSCNARLNTHSAPADVITTRLQLWPRLCDGRYLFELTCTEVAANCNSHRSFLAIASGFGKKKLKQTLTPAAHHTTPWAAPIPISQMIFALHTWSAHAGITRATLATSMRSYCGSTVRLAACMSHSAVFRQPLLRHRCAESIRARVLCGSSKRLQVRLCHVMAQCFIISSSSASHTSHASSCVFATHGEAPTRLTSEPFSSYL